MLATMLTHTHALDDRRHWSVCLPQKRARPEPEEPEWLAEKPGQLQVLGIFLMEKGTPTDKGMSKEVMASGW